MANRAAVFGLLIIVPAGLSFAVCSAAAEPKAVIELFTSQGCSSCPPADALLNKLHNDPSLVTLSLPIDYWDYLGWKDTLADPHNSARQRAYSHTRGDRDVYTPQVVVNGAAEALGSDEAQVETAIVETRHNAAALSVPVAIAVKDNSIVVDAHPKSGDTASVWLCGVARSMPITIGRGENHGKTITYTNVVRRWIKLGTLDGAVSPAPSWTLPLNEVKTEGVDTLVVLVQRGSDDKPGLMLGAATASLR